MTYKTLLAILQSEADTPNVLDFALPFAARHGSHVIGLHAEALPIAFAAAAASPMGGPVIGFTPELEEISDRRQAALRALFEDRTRAEGVSAEWRGFENVSGNSAISGIESARSCDLVIVRQNDPDGESRSTADIEALLFDTGRPVLILPHTHSGRGQPFSKVLLAWNGSKEAARAAFDALPLMKEAGAVEVLSVDPEDTLQQDRAFAGTAVAAALARHGVDVTLRTEELEGRSHRDVITGCMAQTGADLLVMGAYGRSRLSEFVFGGVTRGMLQSMPMPTLMAR